MRNGLFNPDMSLAARAALGVMLLITLVAVVIGYFFFSHDRNDYLYHHVDLHNALQRDATQLIRSIEDLRRDALVLARMPPMQGIIRASRNAGFDAREGVALAFWEKRLEEYFSGFLETNPQYFQARYIGVADGGRELVRVELQGGRGLAIPRERLQRKGDRDYFQATVKLKPGEVHLSGINFNQAQEKIQAPHTRTLRAATPIFTSGGDLYGIVVINLDIGPWLDGAGAGLPRGAKVYIMNAAGDYLTHPDPGRSFGFELGRRHAWQEDLPGLQLPQHPSSAPEALQTLSGAAGPMYVAAKRVQFDPAPERFLTLAYALPDTVADDWLAGKRRITVLTVGAFALILGGGMFLFLRRMFAPLARLTEQAGAIGAGRYDVPLPEEGGGEVAILAHAMADMRQRIRTREVEQARLMTVLEASLNEVYIFDAETLRFSYVNRSARENLGYSSEALKGLTPVDLKPEFTAAAFRQRIAPLLRHEQSQLVFQTMHQRANETLYPVEVHLQLVELGQQRQFLAVIFDISERKQAENALWRSERNLKEAQRIARIGSWELDLVANAMTWSDEVYRILEIDPRELAASYEAFLNVLPPEDRNFVSTVYADAVKSKTPFEVAHRLLMKDGRIKHVQEHCENFFDQDDRPVRTIGTVQDVTERVVAEKRIEGLNRVYAVLSEVNNLIVRVRDRDELLRGACRIAVDASGFMFANIAMADPDSMEFRLVASSSSDASYLEKVGKLFSALHKEMETSAAAQFLRERIFGQRLPIVSNDVKHELTNLTDAIRKHIHSVDARSWCVLPLVIADRTVGILSLRAREAGFFDAKEMKLLTELAGDIAFAIDHLDKADRLDYLAYHDPLTGLANATLFRERLAQHLGAANGKQQITALILLDVERFKTVNDALGRHAGDELLKHLAKRLVACAGSADLVAHLGEDRFATIFPGIANEVELARLIEEGICCAFDQPFRLRDIDFKAAARYGVALYPGDGADPETLFRNAGVALKKAKAGGERYLFYAQQMNERVAEQFLLESKLRQALQREEFVLHYQPKIELATKRIAGVEALIRWNDPVGGLVPPLRFIPLLEETGLILEVGAWALRRAARDYGHWLEAGLAAPRIAVNVSAIQLRQKDFVEVVRQALCSGPSPHGIDLEITESLLMENIEDNIGKLTAIRDMGANIGIDDFGTGYSSLAYLTRLPAETIKIDRSFILAMLHDPNTMTLVSTIIALGHSLGLKVVAEGVETQAQENKLRSLKCDKAQGYLYGKPIPFEEMSTLIGTSQGGSTA